MVDARDLKSLDQKWLYGFDSRWRHEILTRMAKTEFCIINKHNHKLVKEGGYDECLQHFNAQDKVFRKTHKLINKKDYKPYV